MAARVARGGVRRALRRHRVARDDGGGARHHGQRARIARRNPDPRRGRGRPADRAAQDREPRHRASSRDDTHCRASRRTTSRSRSSRAGFLPRVCASTMRVSGCGREAVAPPSFMPRWLTVVVDEAAIANFLIVSPGGAGSGSRTSGVPQRSRGTRSISTAYGSTRPPGRSPARAAAWWRGARSR